MVRTICMLSKQQKGLFHNGYYWPVQDGPVSRRHAPEGGGHAVLPGCGGAAVLQRRDDLPHGRCGRLPRVRSRACGRRSKPIRNLRSISAPKNGNLSQKIVYTASKSIRGRLLSYCPIRPCAAGAAALLSPFTASRWPTTPIWTAARCQMN